MRTGHRDIGREARRPVYYPGTLRPLPGVSRGAASPQDGQPVRGSGALGDAEEGGPDARGGRRRAGAGVPVQLGQAGPDDVAVARAQQRQQTVAVAAVAAEGDDALVGRPRPREAAAAAAGAQAPSCSSVSGRMSIFQPVSRAARRAFWPSLPIASESW